MSFIDYLFGPFETWRRVRGGHWRYYPPFREPSWGLSMPGGWVRED